LTSSHGFEDTNRKDNLGPSPQNAAENRRFRIIDPPKKAMLSQTPGCMRMIDLPKPVFGSRQNLATPAAIQALAAAQVAREELLRRHFAGDWGDVDPDDGQENDRALDTGARILSAYVLSTGVRVWVMTETASATGVRQATTILLPTEY
jgi:hypothetical protein